MNTWEVCLNRNLLELLAHCLAQQADATGIHHLPSTAYTSTTPITRNMLNKRNDVNQQSVGRMGNIKGSGVDEVDPDLMIPLWVLELQLNGLHCWARGLCGARKDVSCTTVDRFIVVFLAVRYAASL